MCEIQHKLQREGEPQEQTAGTNRSQEEADDLYLAPR